MDRELIERLTDEAVTKVGRGPAWRLVFAALIAEECAKVCRDAYERHKHDDSPSAANTATHCEFAIRERFKV